MYAYMMSDSSQTLCKIPLHSINLTHASASDWNCYFNAHIDVTFLSNSTVMLISVISIEVGGRKRFKKKVTILFIFENVHILVDDTFYF